jgi:hypothetical protein
VLCAIILVQFIYCSGSSYLGLFYKAVFNSGLTAVKIMASEEDNSRHILRHFPGGTELSNTDLTSELPVKSRLQSVKHKVPLLNSESCHEDIWGNGGIAPHILNLGTTVQLRFNDLSH